MPSQVQDAAQRIADVLAQQPSAPSARWRWGTVSAVNSDGTMDVTVAGAALAGIRCMESATGAASGDRVRIAYLGTDAVVDGVRASGGAVETIYETSDITVKRWGRLVMVQCHGIYATPGSGNAWANIDLSAYKPSYNASALLADASGSAHFARLWVSATDGKAYLATAGYSSAASWYGTLTYIF